MRKSRLLAYLVLGLTAWAHAQTPSLFSPHRFSLQLNSAYHFNPWENYNNALDIVSREIALNRFFIAPTGYYEKINGAISAQGELQYHLPEVGAKVFLLLRGNYGKQEAAFEFYPDPAQIVAPWVSPAFHQKINFSFWSAGLGLRYRIPLASKWFGQAGLGVDRYSAMLDLQWRHSRNARGPLPEGSGETLAAKLKDQTWGGQIQFDVGWKILPPVSMVLGVNYRLAKFKAFEGEAIYNLFRAQTFTAELVEDPNYFGVRVKEQPGSSQNAVTLPPLTFLTSPDDKNRTPAVLDLSALGLTLGFQLEF